MKRSQILIIDENPTHQKLASLMAQRVGIEPIVAASADEAITKLNSHPEIRMVIMDLEIPRSANAARCVRLLKKARTLRKQKFSIVASSAYAMDDDKRECLKIGADDTMPKPYTSADFREMIRKNSDRKNGENNDRARLAS